MTTKRKTDTAAPVNPLQNLIDFCSKPEHRGAKKRIGELLGKILGKKMDHRQISYWLNADEGRRITPNFNTGTALLEAGERVMAQMNREKKVSQ